MMEIKGPNNFAAELLCKTNISVLIKRLWHDEQSKQEINYLD